jgi:phage regulator Rha-like protein
MFRQFLLAGEGAVLCTATSSTSENQCDSQKCFQMPKDMCKIIASSEAPDIGQWFFLIININKEKV